MSVFVYCACITYQYTHDIYIHQYINTQYIHHTTYTHDKHNRTYHNIILSLSQHHTDVFMLYMIEYKPKIKASVMGLYGLICVKYDPVMFLLCLGKGSENQATRPGSPVSQKFSHPKSGYPYWSPLKKFL